MVPRCSSAGEEDRVVQLIGLVRWSRRFVDLMGTSRAVLANDRHVEAGSTEVRKVAAAFGERRHRGIERSAGAQPESFITEERKRPVLDNSSTDGCAELVLRERRRLV